MRSFVLQLPPFRFSFINDDRESIVNYYLRSNQTIVKIAAFNNNNNSIDAKNMEEDVSMDEEADGGGGGGGSGGQRHTTPVNGVDAQVTSSTSNITMSAGVLRNGTHTGDNGVDPNRNSVISSSSSSSSNTRESGLLRPGNIIMMTVSWEQDCSGVRVAECACSHVYECFSILDFDRELM